jgi:hypothetical protein
MLRVCTVVANTIQTSAMGGTGQPRRASDLPGDAMMGAALGRTAILLAATTVAAGCAASSWSAHPAVARPPHRRATAGRAVAAAERRVRCGQWWQQARIPLPAGFAAEAAVLCDPAVHLADGQGRAVDIERVADRGLAPLVAALRRPSERPEPGMICPAQLVVVPLLLLIDQEGQIIRPVIPADGCGQPQQQVLNALQRIPWVTG